MAFPVDVVKRTVTTGPVFDLASGAPLGIEMKITPSRSLVRGGSPNAIPGIARVYTVKADPGMQASTDLPVTDQKGWFDGAGNAMSVADGLQTHTYVLEGTYKDENGRSVGTSMKKTISLPAGDLSTVDLDAVVPVTNAAGVTVAVPDVWSQDVVAARAAAENAAAALVDSDAFVAEKVADPESLTGAALSATYVTRVPVPARPDDIDGLVGWWDASVLTGLADGAAVESWANAGSAGGTASQSSGAARPVYRSSPPAVEFDGVNDRLGLDAAARAMLRNVSGVTAIAVAHPTAGVTAQEIITLSDGTNASRNRFFLNARGDDGKWRLGVRRLDAGNHPRLTGGAMTGARTLVAARVSYAEAWAEVWQEGSRVAVAPEFDEPNPYGAPTANTVSASGNIGASPDATFEFFDGMIHEIIVFDRALSDDELDRVTYGLAQKWELPWSRVTEPLPWGDAAQGFDANLLSGVGSPVSVLPDVTGRGSPFAAAVNPPVLVAGQALDFSGADNRLVSNNGEEAVATLISAVRGAHLFAVVSTDSTAAGNCVAYLYRGTSSGSIILAMGRSGSAAWALVRRTTSSASTQLTGGSLGAGLAILEVRADFWNGEVALYVNGAQVASARLPESEPALAASGSSLESVIGGNSSSSAFWDGRIAAFFAWKRCLSRDEATEVRKTLAARHRIMLAADDR